MSSWNVNEFDLDGLTGCSGTSRLIIDCNGSGVNRQLSLAQRQNRSVRTAIPDLEAALLQHPRRDQLLLNIPLQDLNQKLSQISTLRFGPRHPDKALHRSAK